LISFVGSNEDEEQEPIETFADSYKNSLKSFRSTQSFHLNENTFEPLLQNISRLKNLEGLDLCLE
jgi:hypothetical protein